MPTTGPPYFIEYEENEGYTESFSQGGPQITRILEVPWDKREQFVWNMLGWTEYISGALLQRVLPDVFPKFTNAFGYENLYAAEMRLVDCLGVPDIEPDDTEVLRYLDRVPTDPVPAVGQEVFGKAKYEVVYRPRTYQLWKDEDINDELRRYVTKTSQPSVAGATIPGVGLRWADRPEGTDGAIIPENLVKLLMTREWTYTWHQIPADQNGNLPEGLQANILSCIGKVNKTRFDVLQGANYFRPEELLCLAPHLERYHDAHGDLMFDIGYKFIERSTLPDTGWNTSLRSVNAAGTPAMGFYSIVGRGNADPPVKLYDPVEFAKLFSMEAAP